MIDFSEQLDDPDLIDLAYEVMGLPRIKAFAEVVDADIYLGFTVSPPEHMYDIVPRKALQGPFPSKAEAEKAASLLGRFCVALGSGLFMPDIFYGSGKKLNNELLMDVVRYIEDPSPVILRKIENLQVLKIILKLEAADPVS